MIQIDDVSDRSYAFPTIDFKFHNPGGTSAVLWQFAIEVLEAKLDLTPVLTFAFDVDHFPGIDRAVGGPGELIWLAPVRRWTSGVTRPDCWRCTLADAHPLPRFLPRRELGRTGFRVTSVGIGDLADRSIPLEQCVATLHRAMDAGLNLVDTAPGYEDGYSEEIVGEALRGRRDGMFVIDKIDFLDQPVTPQVETSLGRLKLDAVDLFVFHNVSELAIWQKLAAPGGGMAELGRCIQAGKARFRGISSHHPDVLRAALETGLCDVVMFPVGPFCHPRYVEEILPLARAKEVGTVCFKTFGAGKLLGDTEGYGRPLQSRPRGKVSSGGHEAPTPSLPHLSVEECVRYTLTVDPDVALLGMSFTNEQDAALTAAAAFRALTPEQLADVRRRASLAIEGKGKVWWDPVETPRPAANG